MTLKTLGLIQLFILALAGAAWAQAPGPAGQFQVTKITKNLITTPQYTVSGGQQYQADQRARWLEIEVEFASVPDFTDDLTFKYFVLLGDKVLTGEVTHTNVAAGRANRSVMYISPDALARFNGNRPVAANSVGNIAVQIVEKGAVKDELSLTRAAAQWYATLPQVTGMLLNKNESPFGPLYWDRYEQIKPAGR